VHRVSQFQMYADLSPIDHDLQRCKRCRLDISRPSYIMLLVVSIITHNTTYLVLRDRPASSESLCKLALSFVAKIPIIDNLKLVCILIHKEPRLEQ